ncbi:hypothetical protein BC834DRAFT_1041101 [Gloeopeniophorella convolvens]|nr:hypothetical protein BC834DRAFT_1041101 [Gloeopeniophorella convolvens]
MLRSTVTSGSYILEKYSRSYPPPASVQAQAHSQSQTTAARQPEWQHFVNPVIKLTLDIKKSMDNSFESVCLRIAWNMMDHDTVQREITMEDLDLLSFSADLGSQMTPVQGLPLKAVYRGVVVGIRYQYPLSVPATSPASYRRFQVNFASTAEATQFVDAIRPVCPCKENAGPPAPQIPTHNPAIQAPPVSMNADHPAGQAPLSRYHTSTLGSNQVAMPPPAALQRQHTTLAESAYRRSHAQQTTRFPPSSSSDLSLAPSSDLAPSYTTVPDGSSSRPSSALPEAPVSQPATQYEAPPSSSLPQSSQPTPSAATLALQGFPSATPDGPAPLKTREAFLESLREVPELYNLTRSELENLVSVVVREPGFPRLLASLDSMWAVHGFLKQ